MLSLNVFGRVYLLLPARGSAKVWRHALLLHDFYTLLAILYRSSLDSLTSGRLVACRRLHSIATAVLASALA